jgi:hypothetical protein
VENSMVLALEASDINTYDNPTLNPHLNVVVEPNNDFLPLKKPMLLMDARMTYCTTCLLQVFEDYILYK